MAIDSARSKLGEILSELSERFEGSSPEDDDSTNVLSPDRASMPPPTTPSKRAAPRTPRKRRRRELSSESDFESSSRPRYTVTLFDRAVDLAQFDEDTQMYEMCRAWMINRPNVAYDQWQGFSEKSMMDAGIPSGSSAVLSLPAPPQHDPFTPIPLPPACKTNKLEDVIDKGTDIQELKKDNMARWRKVAVRWREASFRSQQRHMDSVRALKSLFIQQP